MSVSKPDTFPPYPPEDNIGLGKNDTLKPWAINQVPVDNDYNSGVEVNLADKLMQAIIQKRNYYRKIAYLRYRELILNIRGYVNTPVSFNKLKCEWYLRNGNHVAVGKDALGNFQLLGTVNDTNSTTSPETPFSDKILTDKDIRFVLPERLVPHETHEITHFDNAKTGDFVVLRNKPFEYVNDFSIVKFYCDRLAEIMSARASLIMQAKQTTVVPVQSGNSEDADQIVNTIYNGAPYLLLNNMNVLRLKESLVSLGDASVSEKIKTLKEAFNDEQNELNNILGINTTGIDKASGVSDKEVDSNNDYVLSTTNMYIKGVKEGLDLYNARFGTHYGVVMNQPSLQELNLGGELTDADDNNA